MIHNLLIHNGIQIDHRMRGEFPERFNNPFSYVPHPLCREAAECVREYLRGRKEWHEELGGGKMFGVLVVRTRDDKLGYLAAFSGNLQGRNDWEFFVPPVYDLLSPDEFFKVGEREISALNGRIAAMESSGELLSLKSRIAQVEHGYMEEIARLKEIYASGRAVRERRRASLMEMGGGDAADELASITRESQFQKGEIRRAGKRMKEALLPLQEQLDCMWGDISQLKALRKEKSARLQEEIFRHFVFLNGAGERRSLLDIFSGQIPPGGAGECAAPKLLQYAFLHGMHPLCMGEFWWGDTPRGELRRDGEFYPSCMGKCAPILGFMLQGLDVEPVGVHSSYGCAGQLEILYSDEHIIAVNKPAGVLSVPGRGDDRVGLHSPSTHETDLLELLASSGRFSSGQLQGLKAVHRLDMHTSGVLLLARTEAAYKELQRQFASREVQKTYIAVLDGEVAPAHCGCGVVWDTDAAGASGAFGAFGASGASGGITASGTISLPLAPDYDHRPAQMVDFNGGKEAVTRFRILESYVEDTPSGPAVRTRVEFCPITGRTHQLRVHAAHPMGLNVPIAGDLLYGRPAGRLMLHAQSVTFTHPHLGQMTITAGN